MFEKMQKKYSAINKVRRKCMKISFIMLCVVLNKSIIKAKIIHCKQIPIIISPRKRVCESTIFFSVRALL